jgi:hypothetical protein
MHANGSNELRMCIHERNEARPIRQIDTHDQRSGNLIGMHARQNFWQITGQIGEIEMAVGIDVH